MNPSDAVAVITGSDVVVPGEVKFTGRVRHTDGKVSWISEVRRGYETVPTNGDVFCPKSIPAGTWVEFDQSLAASKGAAFFTDKRPVPR